MRALCAVLLIGAASVAGAQFPDAPVAPATAKAKSSSWEMRVGGFMISGERSYEFFQNVENTTGSVKGVEAVLRSKVIGLSFRSLTSEFGTQPHVTSADARILLFPPIFTVMVGAGRRALWSDLNAESPTQFDLGLAGVSSTMSIGGSGLRTNVSAAVYLPAGEAKDRVKGGMEGEASVLYTFPKVPLFVQLGYRTEIFTSKGENFETPEEMRGIRVGGGIQFGGR
jgi:hypothetical protein